MPARPVRRPRLWTSGAGPVGKMWVEVGVVTSAEAAEAVGAILRDLRTGGLVEERPSETRVRFRCYLPPSRLLPATLRTLRTRIRGIAQYGLDPSPARVVTRRSVAVRRWATAWRAYVRPVRIGRLLIRPSWIRIPEQPGRTVIEIDPGMAFGTGMHPTTRMCLRVLLRHLSTRRWDPGPIVFDIGTGSGILAIAAARLGAARVRAVDVDPVAVTTARTNVRRNRVTHCVQVARGTGLGGASGRADLILANLIARTIIPLLAHIPKHLAPRGVFVGSGIIADQVPAVLWAARVAGLRSVQVLSEGEWRAVVLRHRTSPAIPRSVPPTR